MSILSLNKINLKSILSIWLDVSKSKIDVCCLISDNKDINFQIQNTKQWIIDFINILKDNNFDLKIPLIIESTWDYNTLACLLLSENLFNVKEINPIITKNYVKHTIRWTKTDKTDAKALANIWLQEKDNLFTFNKSRNFISISKKISLIANLEKQIQSLKMTIKNFNNVISNLELDKSKAVESIEITIIELGENIKVLKFEIEETKLWDSDKNKVDIINSITWVSKYMAIAFYISFAYKDFASKKAMYAFLWFDPKLKDSWNFSGKACISKRWNAYIRKKLFQSALCAKLHCKIFKDIYDKQKERWKHHFTCLINVSKKIVHIIFSLLKNNTLFNPNFGTF